jgi:pyruvate/2-oxoglutarate dehydrogenase complex dihydrolipoamide acyltransferase (E2) component
MSQIVDYKLADVGEGIAEAEVIEWLVAVGDLVSEDQPVIVVETDKSQIEIPAPVSGKVIELCVVAGDVLAVGSSLMKIEASGEVSNDISAHAWPATPSRSAVTTNDKTDLPSTPGSRATNVRPLASPSTRRLAASLGVALENVLGSGPNGQITAEDIQAASATASPTSSPKVTPAVSEPGVTVIPLRGLRRQIAASMSQALSIPHILEFKEIDATALLALRSDLTKDFQVQGQKLSVTPFLMRACVLALAKHKTFNARFDSEAAEIAQFENVNLGFATATDDGLIVPVIQNAQNLSVKELAQETDNLASLAKSRKASLEQLSGGTFTLTNFGSFGTWLGTPIIHSPEVAIAGFGRITEKVLAVDGIPTVRMVLPIVVAADHRVNDGAHLGAFVSEIADLLLRPLSLLENK